MQPCAARERDAKTDHRTAATTEQWDTDPEIFTRQRRRNDLMDPTNFNAEQWKIALRIWKGNVLVEEFVGPDGISRWDLTEKGRAPEQKFEEWCEGCHLAGVHCDGCPQ